MPTLGQWQIDDAVRSYDEAIREIGRRVREGAPLPPAFDRLFKPSSAPPKRG